MKTDGKGGVSPLISRAGGPIIWLNKEHIEVQQTREESNMQGKRVLMVVTLGLAGWLVIPLLARVQQPGPEAGYSLAEGNGKALVRSSCVGCHSMETSLRRGRSREEWVITVNDMVSRGAQILPADTLLPGIRLHILLPRLRDISVLGD